MNALLVGNPNSGKSTLFNALTGLSQHVGNFPGVTVEKHSGKFRDLPGYAVIDLPGAYSFTALSREEAVLSDALTALFPDVIINIVDATCLSRSLYMTLQLLELGAPVVVALNMIDEVRKAGGSVDAEKLSSILGVPVLPISAARREGIGELVAAVRKAAGSDADKQDTYAKEGWGLCAPRHCRAVGIRAHNSVPGRASASLHPQQVAPGSSPQIPESGGGQGTRPLRIPSVPVYFDGLENQFAHEYSKNERHIIERYQRIDRMIPLVVKGLRGDTARSLTKKIDAVLLHPALAFPAFFFMMGFIFYAAYGPIGQALTNVLQNAVTVFSGALGVALTHMKVQPWIHALCVDGIMSGICIVLSFFPTLLILFFLLSLLEDSGYIARMAFVSDHFFRKIGLSGRSFVPALLGFGCSVPAILSTRTLPSRRDRHLTILLAPFLSCSAKLPIYALFAKAFFADFSPFAIMGLYFPCARFKTTAFRRSAFSLT